MPADLTLVKMVNAAVTVEEAIHVPVGKATLARTVTPVIILF